MKAPLATDDLERPLFLIRNVADVNRLIIRVLTRWTLPRVEIHVDSLPAVTIQLIQHRIAHRADAPTGGLGVTLAATAAVVGVYLAWLDLKSMIWTPRQFWQHLAFIAIAALYAGLIGKSISVAVARVRLVLVLSRLRRLLAGGKAVEVPARYIGRDLPKPAAAISATPGPADIGDNGMSQGDIVPSTVLSRPRPPRVLIRNIADMKRLLIHLLTHWKLPRVQIGVDGVAPLDVQRAQHRIALLSEACNCVLGACLGAAVILGGAFVVEWVSSHNWDWWVPESWGALGLVPAVALGAVLAGVAIEMVWTRVKLMLVVRGVRHRLGT